MVRGYWNRPEETAASFTRGWLHTGDVARIDEEGFVHIVDRAKDMIIRGGENVYCVEVEDALFEHPAVADCAVIGVPHPVLGEEVGAVVVLRPGHDVGADELARFVASGWRPSTCRAASGSGRNPFPATRPARCSSASCGPSSSGTPPADLTVPRSAPAVPAHPGRSRSRVVATSRPIWAMSSSTVAKASSSRSRATKETLASSP